MQEHTMKMLMDKYYFTSCEKIGTAGGARVTILLIVLNNTLRLPLLFVTRFEKDKIVYEAISHFCLDI